MGVGTVVHYRRAPCVRFLLVLPYPAARGPEQSHILMAARGQRSVEGPHDVRHCFTRIFQLDLNLGFLAPRKFEFAYLKNGNKINQ